MICESTEARTRVLGNTDAAAFLACVEEAIYLTLRERAYARPVVRNWEELLDYLRGTQGHSSVEIARVLFLNSRNCLLKDEMIAHGTVDEAPFWPRQIVKRCLELDASAILLVHNHPSGDATPSQADIALTRSVARQCTAFGIRLFDHVIVTDREHVSMRAENLI